MSLAMICLDRRSGAKVCQIIQRASGSPGIESLGSSGQKTKKVGFGKTMKIDHEIKLLRSNFFNDFENAQDRKRLKAIAQTDAIHDQRFVSETRQSHHLCSGLANRDRNPRSRK